MEKYAGDRSMPAAFRGQVSQWLSEYSETNHARMLKVVETLKRMDGDRYLRCRRPTGVKCLRSGATLAALAE